MNGNNAVDERMSLAEQRDRHGLELVAANAFFTRETLAQQTSMASVRRLYAGGLIEWITRGERGGLELTSQGREVYRRSGHVW